MKTDNKAITNSSVLAEMSNSQYIHIAEKTAGKKPSHFARDNNIVGTTQALDFMFNRISLILASIVLRLRPIIKSSQLHLLETCGANAEEMSKLLSALDTTKAVGYDMVVKMAASFLCQSLSNVINNSLTRGIFPDDCDGFATRQR